MMKVHFAEYVSSAVKPGDYPAADRPEVAFAGRSNVGKSTLINTLVGRRNLARISRQPGKTRCLNFFDINHTFYLVDLPGYGWSKVSRSERESWGRMVETYLRRRDTLRVVLLLVDLRRGLGEMDRQLYDYLKSIKKPCLIVLTKADKLKGNEQRNQIRRVLAEIALTTEQVLIVSGLTRDGLPQLWECLASFIN